MTIWRDLNDLANAGLIERIRGGALAIERAQFDLDSGYDRAQDPHAEKKRLIGYYVANNLINEGDSITIEAGSTANSIIPYLNIPHLTVLTNGLLTSLLVYKSSSNIMLMCSGGVLIKNGAFIGPQVEDFFTNYHTQKAFLGAEGVTLEEGFTDSTPLYTHLKKVMSENAEQTIMMLDSSKIGFPSLVQVMKIKDINILVTDPAADPTIIDTLNDNGIEVHIARVIE